MTSLRIEQNNIPETVSAQVIQKLYDTVLSVPEPSTGEQDSASLKGTLQTTHAYRSNVEYLVARFPELFINVTNSYYIEFEDPIIKQYCVQNYGDGVGVTENVATSITLNQFWGFHTNMDNYTKSLVTSLNDFQYFTHTSLSGGSNEGIVYNFPNATSIKFPNITFQYNGVYNQWIVNECNALRNINYGDAIFVSPNDGNLYVIYGNSTIENWSDSLLPKQNSYYGIRLFLYWRKLKKVIFPEGKTHVADNWQGCTSMEYIEYPSTIEDIGWGRNLGRDMGHRLPCMVIKAVTPPRWSGWDPTETGYSEYGLGWCNLPLAIYVPDNSVTAYKSISSGGTTSESLWANPAIIQLIKPMSEMPQLYIDMGTVTQQDIDRV